MTSLEIDRETSQTDGSPLSSDLRPRAAHDARPLRRATAVDPLAGTQPDLRRA